MVPVKLAYKRKTRGLSTAKNIGRKAIMHERAIPARPLSHTDKSSL